MIDAKLEEQLAALDSIKAMLKERRFGASVKTADAIDDGDEHTRPGGKLPTDDSEVSASDPDLEHGGQEDEQGKDDGHDEEDDGEEDSKHGLLTRLALASVKGMKKK